MITDENPLRGVVVVLGPRCLDTWHLAGSLWKENQGNSTTHDYPSHPAEQAGNNLKHFLSRMAQVKAGMRARLSEVWLSRAGCPWKENQGNCTTPDYPSAGTGGVYALSLQVTLSLSLSLSLSNTHTHTHTHTHTPAASTLSRSRRLSLSLSRSITLSLTHTLTHTHTGGVYALSFQVTLSLSLSLSRSHSL